MSVVVWWLSSPDSKIEAIDISRNRLGNNNKNSLAGALKMEHCKLRHICLELGSEKAELDASCDPPNLVSRSITLIPGTGTILRSRFHNARVVCAKRTRFLAYYRCFSPNTSRKIHSSLPDPGSSRQTELNLSDRKMKPIDLVFLSAWLNPTSCEPLEALDISRNPVRAEPPIIILRF